MNIKLRLITIALLLAGIAVSYAQRQGGDTLTAQPVRGSVHVLLAKTAGNIAISAGPDGAFVIDDHFASVAPQILAAAQKLTDKPIRYVLNTHWHPDHAGGNVFFGGQGTVIVAHDTVRKRMSREAFSVFSQKTTPASPTQALPVVTFSENMTFHFNGDTVRVVHLPDAHTDGDAIFYFEQANVLHAGDVFVRYGFPFIDVASNGSIAGMIAGCDRILEIANPETLIIPGHGKVAREADVIEFRDMLKTARARVVAGLKAGKTAEQIAAAKPLADLMGRWGGGFIKPELFIRAIATSEAP